MLFAQYRRAVLESRGNARTTHTCNRQRAACKTNFGSPGGQRTLDKRIAQAYAVH